MIAKPLRNPEPKVGLCLPTQTLQQRCPLVFCMEIAVQGLEGDSEGQSPRINAVLRNKSLWHQQNPKEHFPSCLEQGPAGVPLTAPCKPPLQPKTAGERVLQGSCYNNLPSHPEWGAQRWTQLPADASPGTGPTSTGSLPLLPQGCAELLTCTPPLRGRNSRISFTLSAEVSNSRSSAVSGGHLATWISRQWLIHTSWDSRTCSIEKGYYQRSPLSLDCASFNWHLSFF